MIAHGKEKNPTVFSKQFMVGVFYCCWLVGFFFLAVSQKKID